LKHLGDALVETRRWLAAIGGSAHQFEVVVYGERAQHLPAFGREADALSRTAICWNRGQILAVEEDTAGLRRQQPNHGIEQGRLSGAIGAEDADRLALRHDEVHVAEHAELAVTAAETFDHQGVVHVRTPI
jgi:hypothetical protein